MSNGNSSAGAGWLADVTPGDLNRELIKYMRGDTSAGGVNDPAGGIDHYMHSYYEDIEPLYREQIFKLGV